MIPLNTLQVSYAKGVVRTSEELQALGESLQRLTLSNESLSLSNKTLTDILYFQRQDSKNLDSGVASTTSSTDQKLFDGPNGNLSIASFAVSASPNTGQIRPQKPTSPDSTHDHLQRCMDSVQELAKTISCAMSAWQGQEKTGSSDIHGSHAELVAELGKLPSELQCKQCFGRVPWAHFDLTKAAFKCLGTCTCVSQTSSSLWRPCDTTVAYSVSAASDSPVLNAPRDVEPPPIPCGGSGKNDSGRGQSTRDLVPNSRDCDKDESLEKHIDIARQCFVPGDGIDRHVMVTDIQRYLGNDATVRPGKGTGENTVGFARHRSNCAVLTMSQGVTGYWIKAYRNLTTVCTTFEPSFC
jgi:hypothetical protein